MKRFLIISTILAVLSGQVFAAGSGSGGGLPPDNSAEEKAAADKAALEKVAADKAAADKAVEIEAVNKAAAEKKAAADKAAADKATTDKAAADKLQSDKAAADKTAADKAVEAKNTTVKSTTTVKTAPKTNVNPSSTKAVEAVKNTKEKPKWCDKMENLKERVKCRLEKETEEVAEELEEKYLPEECRAESDPAKQSTCTARYKSLQPCWDAKIGPERISCVKTKLDLPEKLEKLEKVCEGKDEKCNKEYKEKIYNLIKFRFYDAEERVEEWYEDGKISADEATEFVTFIVEAKLRFNESTTKAERVSIISDVMKKWGEMVSKVKSSNK